MGSRKCKGDYSGLAVRCHSSGVHVRMMTIAQTALSGPGVGPTLDARPVMVSAECRLLDVNAGGRLDPWLRQAQKMPQTPKAGLGREGLAHCAVAGSRPIDHTASRNRNAEFGFHCRDALSLEVGCLRFVGGLRNSSSDGVGLDLLHHS